MNAIKEDVQKFWEAQACGERLYLVGTDRPAYEAQAVGERGNAERDSGESVPPARHEILRQALR